MKIIPQDRTRSVYPKSFVDKVNFPDAIDRYKSNELTANTNITFIGSESRFEKFMKSFSWFSGEIPQPVSLKIISNVISLSAVRFSSAIFANTEK